MYEAEVLQILGYVGAVIKDSHIVYTSGKHGSAYVNKDALYPDTSATSTLCREIALQFHGDDIEVVVGPAMGGVILSQWVAYHLRGMTRRKILAIYAEKQVVTIPDPEGLGRKVYAETGKFVFNRGYDKYVAGKRVLVVEDVITTGGSALRVVEAVRHLGGRVSAVSVLCNRGSVTPEMLGDVPQLSALINVKLDAWDEADCPLCKTNVPVNTSVGKGKEFLERKQLSKS